MLKRLAPIAMAVAATVLCAAPVSADFKNLQVLPKNISKDELKSIMREQAKALGVECDHCHQLPDTDKDTDNKKIAREMMRMTADINAKYIKDPKVKVTCATCHRGKQAPEVVGK